MFCLVVVGPPGIEPGTCGSWSSHDDWASKLGMTWGFPPADWWSFRVDSGPCRVVPCPKSVPREGFSPHARPAGDLLEARVHPCRAEGRGARYGFQPCTPPLGLAAVSARREEITSLRLLISEAVSGSGGARPPG